MDGYAAWVGEPVLDPRVNVAQLWGLACDAARKGEKWGQRKKSVSDAMETYYAQLGRDKRGAKQWVATVADVLGFFDPSGKAPHGPSVGQAEPRWSRMLHHLVGATRARWPANSSRRRLLRVRAYQDALQSFSSIWPSALHV